MKKKLTMCLSVALIAVMAICGTLAYLTSEDSDVNVMTLGNVKIKQHEYERVEKADGKYEMVTSDKYGEGYKVQPFTQGKPLYPATGEITGWGTNVPFDQIEGASGTQAVLAGLNNVQDKFVLVENTGKSDTYVRTYIALEYGSNEKDIIGITTGDFWKWNEIGIVEIDGNNYFVYEAIYTGSDSRHVGGILPAGEYTYNNLGQVYMSSEATNEDVEAIDGNNNGTYDILVLSQAIQTEGFADAETALNTGFGKANAANIAEWFGDTDIPVLVYSFAEMIEVCKTGGKMILGTDLTYTAENTESMISGSLLLVNGKNVTLDLNGYDITIAEDATQLTGALFFVGNPGGHVNIVGDGEINVKNGLTTAVWTLQGGTADISGGTYTSNSASNEAMFYSQGNGGVINIYGGKYVYDLAGHLNGGFNVSDNAGANLRIILHEGVLLNRPEYSQHLQGTANGEDNRIQLAEGCSLEEVVIDGVTWYQVVKN